MLRTGILGSRIKLNNPVASVRLGSHRKAGRAPLAFLSGPPSRSYVHKNNSAVAKRGETPAFRPMACGARVMGAWQRTTELKCPRPLWVKTKTHQKMRRWVLGPRGLTQGANFRSAWSFTLERNWNEMAFTGRFIIARRTGL